MTEITQTTVGVNSVYIIDDVNNTLVVDATQARVGIGTTTPGYELSVAGTIHGTGLVQGVNLTIASGGGGVLTFQDGTTQATAGAPGTMSSWILSDGSATQTISDGNTVQVLGGTGLTSAVTATDTVTLNLDNTAVTPAAYGDATNVAQFTVDQQGRLTAAAAVAITYPAKAQFTLTADSGSNQTIADGNTMDIAGGTGLSSVVGATDTVTLNLDNTAVTAGSYTRASLTVDAQGRLTAASSGAAPDISGTIAAGQVAYGASADTIEGDNNLFWDTTNDRLGIGTATPASSLHIIGIDDDNPEVRVQRSVAASQFISIMNEDAAGGIIRSEASEGNKKPLYLDSVHDGGGSAAGSNLVSIRTGPASGPTPRMEITDNTNPGASTSDPQVIIQSGTYLLVDDQIRVGNFVSGPTPTDYSISVSKGSSTISGGLFSSSIGESAIGNTNAGWWLTANGMNTTSKYTPAIKFGSTDNALTTDNPKYLAGIVGRATETYSADTDGGMALDFLTFPNSSSATGGPTTRMTIDQDGQVGIGAGLTSPAAALHVRTQNDSSTFVALFESEDDGSSASPDIGLLRDSASPAASDDLGHFRFRGKHSGGSDLDYADMFAEIGSPTDGAEAGYLNLRVAHANNSGNITDFIRLRGDVTGAVVINDSGRADVDFRVETDTNTSALFIDASANTAEINVPLNLGSTLTHYNNAAPAAGQLLIGDATAGVWDAATLTAGSNVTITNADGAITIAASGGGGGGSPGGANNQVQYNNGGAFGADGNFIYDPTAPAVAVGFTPAGQTSGSLNTDALIATNTVDSGIITGSQKVGTPAFVQQGAAAPTYGLTLTDANMAWPGAPLGSSTTIMPVIDLSAGNYDFATLNGAGNCSQTHYLFIQVGQAPNAVLMPDPAAAGLPAGSRWTIHNLDNAGNSSLIEFGAQVVPPCPPLSQVFTNIEFNGIGSVTLFTDGVEWFVESDTCVQNRGAITINYL